MGLAAVRRCAMRADAGGAYVVRLERRVREGARGVGSGGCVRAGCGSGEAPASRTH
eukprot:gene10281-8296_t